jgi:hypothetical protein
MHQNMRAPNMGLFIVTMLLALIGVWEYVGAPVAIPQIVFPMVNLSSDDAERFLAAHAFWLAFMAWFFLAIGSVRTSSKEKARMAAQPAG